jgi:acetylornithine deacetylase/succinyl-diaminopimelate desuccinylase-like protein
VLAEARAALAHLKGIEVHYQSVTLSCFTGATFEVDDFHAAWSLPPRHEMVRCAQEALTRAGLSTELYLAPYSSNGAASAGELGLPTLLYGAGEIENAHIVDETLRVTALEQAYDGYQALVCALSEP